MKDDPTVKAYAAQSAINMQELFDEADTKLKLATATGKSLAVWMYVDTPPNVNLRIPPLVDMLKMFKEIEPTIFDDIILEDLRNVTLMLAEKIFSDGELQQMLDARKATRDALKP